MVFVMIIMRLSKEEQGSLEQTSIIHSLFSPLQLGNTRHWKKKKYKTLN